MLLVASSYIVEINIMSAIVAGEPLALISLSNAGVVEMEAELLDRGALPVPESVAFRGSEASQLLVALEAVRAENEVSVTQAGNKNASKVVWSYSEYCQCNFLDMLPGECGVSTILPGQFSG